VAEQTHQHGRRREQFVHAACTIRTSWLPLVHYSIARGAICERLTCGKYSLMVVPCRTSL
jgi:hypothetical protein